MAQAREELPDFVVGIDFGMTYTGVAWTNLLGAHSIQSMRDWPGLPDGLESKVPTKIAYPRDGSEMIWGFMCDGDDETYETANVFERFKIYIDDAAIEAAHKLGVTNVPETVAEAQGLISDYLKQVYKQIKTCLEAATGSWKEKRVEFIFSLPTTWNQETANRFHAAVHAAGFNADNPSKHSTALELTEAEAVAVYLATDPQIALANRDIMLVVDAGGGTTDLGLVEVIDANPNTPSLKQIAAVRGVGIGSTMIDSAFEDLVQGIMDRPSDGPPLHSELALKLARSTAFQSVKHKFGTKAGAQASYALRLDKLGLDISRDHSDPARQIEGGKMHFARIDIQDLFDVQTKGIIRKIDEQLNWMNANRNTDQIKYLVLSGGLGGSAYVKTKIEERFASRTHPNAKKLTVLVSQEPRLAVVKGLVMDRRQKLLYGTAALKTRIARASYGIVCKVPYDPQVHVGAEVVPDQYDKTKKWAVKQISWLIKKGDEIETDSAKSFPFARKIAPEDSNRTWQITIVISHNDAGSLPRSTKEAGASTLCQVTADCSEVPEEQFEVHKNRKLWPSSKSKLFYRLNFDLRVIIAPGDLRFEMWFKDRRYSKSHEAVIVEWDSVGANLRPPTSDGSGEEW